MHLKIPAFGQQKTPIKSGFMRNISFLCSYYGGPEGDRTLDLCVANAALSQLSYEPINHPPCSRFYINKTLTTFIISPGMWKSNH